MILVTGARGSVGRALCARLAELGEDFVATDIDTMDVTDEVQVARLLNRKQPDVIFHLAGAKHAPDGERDPLHVLTVNGLGTRHVLEHAGEAKVILASTCKACDPETAYGASKLIAERMVLNAAGVVCRYYNIPEAGGNVFRLWESLEPAAPIPWTDSWRYFISMEQAVDLTVAAMHLRSGRYSPAPGGAQHMRDVAAELYPERVLVEIPRRRGDRAREPLVANCERWEEVNGYLKIASPHDPAQVEERVAA